MLMILSHINLLLSKASPGSKFRRPIGGPFKQRTPNPKLTTRYPQKHIRRRRRNDGILRLAITDNINVLRDRLLQEIARRQREARQNMQNKLDNVG